MLTIVKPATGGFAGHMDNRERWVAARITASHLNVFLQLIKRSNPATLSGDEFEAAKHLITHCQASAGVFLDSLTSASSVDDLIEINKEFYQMAVSRS